jgi:hypothetical protein
MSQPPMPLLSSRIAAFRDHCAALRNDLARAGGATRERRLREHIVRADEALRAIGEIRVYIAGTPNLGHQASSLRIVERLVHEVGYRGRITLVYENGDAGDEAPSAKTVLLHPHLARATMHDVPCGDAVINAIPMSRAATLAPATLGITGGCEFDASLLARALGVDTMLVLQPFHWRWAVDRVAFADGDEPIVLADDDALGHGFCERAYRVTPGTAAAEGTMRDRLLRHVLRETERSGVATGSVYGLRAAGVSNLDPARALAAYVDAIVGSFSALPRRALVLLFDRVPPPFDPRDRRVRFAAPSTHAELERELAWLAGEPARLLLLHVGGVADGAFIAALARSTLPPLFEGQTTATTAVSSGVPYLQLADAGLDEPPPYARLPESPHAFAAAVAFSEAAAAAFQSVAAGRGDAHDRRVVAAFLAQTTFAGSELRRYAAALGSYYAVRGNDKLDVALMALTTLLPRAPSVA